MTYEEAIYLVKTYIKNDYTRIIVNALEKQIKKKPTHEATLIRCCTCPTCRNVIDEFEEFVPNGGKIRIKTQHCKFCGQALDWSDI